MSKIHNLANLSKIGILGSNSNGVLTNTYFFDGVDDYIQSDAVVGRTGYDMNVSGNVTTGSDGDGNYIQFNGNRVSGVGSNAQGAFNTTPVFTQTTSFTISCKAKVVAFGPSGDNGLYGSYQDAAIYFSSGGDLKFGMRDTVDIVYTNTGGITIGAAFTAHLVYDHTTTKFYVYKNGVLLNTGGTNAPAVFTTNNRRLGDGGLLTSAATSANQYIYHTATRNKALTQAEVTADYALGNTAKNDPSIVAYYIPENLTYNTQYMTAPKTFGGTGWTIGSNATATTNTAVAPDGTTTATTYGINVLGNETTNAITQVNTSITGATIASKTFIVKAFVRVTAGVNTFRLVCSHNGVAEYRSANQTATTTRQEFTFTQAFTSSTSGTGVKAGLTSDTLASAGAFEVRNVRLYLTNETLRDESPNIGGFIGWKTQKVLSCRFKPNSDPTNTPSSGSLISAPRFYLHDRNTTHDIQCRYDDRMQSRTSGQSQGSGLRRKTHAIGVFSWTGTIWQTKLYINGTLVALGNQRIDAPSVIVNTNIWVGRNSSTYFAANIRDARIYTFTGSFSDADAMAIYNGGEPITAGFTKYLQYGPNIAESGTQALDMSANARNGTLTGGVTRAYI